MPDLSDLARAQAFLDTTAALGELSQKWGTIEVQEIARSWVNYLDRVKEIDGPSLAARHQRHYQSCDCLGDKAICCDPTCPCHEPAQRDGPEAAE